MEKHKRYAFLLFELKSAQSDFFNNLLDVPITVGLGDHREQREITRPVFRLVDENIRRDLMKRIEKGTILPPAK